MLNQKIKSREELKEVIESLKKENKSVVTINGCFDLLHPGHIYILYESKKQGDVLAVGINSDASVKRLKGPDRPINNEMTRCEMISALVMVDYVFVFEEDDPREFIKYLKPSIHVNDASYGENCIETEALKTYGGKLYLVKKADVPSTTQIIEKIKSTH